MKNEFTVQELLEGTRKSNKAAGTELIIRIVLLRIVPRVPFSLAHLLVGDVLTFILSKTDTSLSEKRQDYNRSLMILCFKELPLGNTGKLATLFRLYWQKLSEQTY